MKILRALMSLRILLVLVLLAVALVLYRSRAAAAKEEANVILYVPVIMSPSVQPVAGQSLLFKATNITEAPVDVRLMLFGDHDGLPSTVKDFLKVAPGTTVSYLHTPPMGKLEMNDATVDVPEAVRAVFAPIPAGEQGAMRRVVANVQIMRLQAPASATGASLDPPILVPLERCRFEPRNFVPYTGGKWVWNCAPEMSPIVAPR